MGVDYLNSATVDKSKLEMLARCKTVLNFPPVSLNMDRYLGVEGAAQRDFSQLERYRIDNYKHTSNDIHFILKENTQVRIAALHKHRLEFDIDLVQNGVVLAQAKSEGK
jgi:hypothetical protein